MKFATTLSISCLLFLVGCGFSPQKLYQAEDSAIVSNAQDWVFPVPFKKGNQPPHSFQVFETEDACTLFVYDPKEYKNFSMITHFKPGYGKEDFGGGILFRYQNPENYYCLRYNAGTHNLRFYKSIMGDRARFANRTVRIKNKNDWQKLQVVVRNDLLQAYLNDRLVFSREDELIKQGKVGLWVRGSNPKTEFADLTIQP